MVVCTLVQQQEQKKKNNDKNNNNGPICNIPFGVDWGDSGFPGFIIGARRRGLSYHDTEKKHRAPGKTHPEPSHTQPCPYSPPSVQQITSVFVVTIAC